MWLEWGGGWGEEAGVLRLGVDPYRTLSGDSVGVSDFRFYTSLSPRL